MCLDTGGTMGTLHAPTRGIFSVEKLKGKLKKKSEISSVLEDPNLRQGRVLLFFPYFDQNFKKNFKNDRNGLVFKNYPKY